MHQFVKFIVFWNNTLHVSDGLSIHHQDFKSVHTATGICQTDTVACLPAGTRWSSVSFPLASRQQCLSAIYLVLNSWWWMERPTKTC